MKYAKTIGEKIFDVTNVSFFVLFSVTILLPFWSQLIVSLTTTKGAMITRFYFWPEKFSIRAYALAFQNRLIYTAYFNTISRTVVGTALTILVTSGLAYALAHKKLLFRNVLTFYILIPMFFTGGLIPTFLLIRQIGLYNTWWVYILPIAFDSFSCVLIRNYMMTLPKEVEESAKIDGAIDTVIYIRIILPLCKPIIAAVALWTMVGHWNSWFDSMIYTTKQALMTLGYYLRIVLINNQPSTGMEAMLTRLMWRAEGNVTPESLKAAIMIVTILPILFSYPFLQRYFMKGIIIGSLKG